MAIEIAVTTTRGDFTLDVAFESSARVLGVAGPSGSGKTTLLNTVAGLVRPAKAIVRVGPIVFIDTEAGIFVPAHRRRIGYVFQEGRLFPHLSVRRNLLYGTWFTAVRDRTSRFAQVVSLLGIEHLLDRRPQSLSGGEQQRVAIGRALLVRPRLLLLDEPLASLDDARKLEILPYLERLRDEFDTPMIYVSHAPAELARLADETIELAGGRIVGRTP